MRKLPTLADGWQYASLGTLIDPSRPITYGVVQPGDHSDDGIPLVRGGDFSRGWRPIEQMRRITPEVDSSCVRGRLQAGDLVITIKGAEVGVAAQIPNWLDGANISQTNARLAISLSKANPRYVLHYLRSPLGRFEVYRHTKVGAQPGLIFEDIASFNVPIPRERRSQDNIVQLIDFWDEAIEKTERLIAAKGRMFRALLVRTFERVFASHNDLSLAKDIFGPVSERNRPDLPLLAVMQDIGVVRRDELDRRVAMPDGDGSTYKVVQSGDFVISLRSFEGGLEYSCIEGLVSPAYTVLRPKMDIDARYYRHFFKSKSFVGRLDRLVFGIRDGKQIAFRDFGDMKIPHPDIEQQRAIADHLDTVARDIELTRLLATRLDHQRRGLMPKLLTGEWPAQIRDSDLEGIAKLATKEEVSI
jgi:type I restriction enzyme S subunit